MVNKMFKIFSSIFYLLIYFIGALFVLSFFANLFEYSSLHISLKGSAITNFLYLYSTPIKIGTALFASFAIWLTMERMRQTEKQIEEITKNNRFNNFFKHREEFKKEFTNNRFFIEVKDLTERDVAFEIGLLYNLFYYQSPNLFEPHLNSESEIRIKNFLSRISNSDLDKEGYNLEDFDLQELKKISDENFHQIKSLLTSIHSRLTPQIRKTAQEYEENIRPLLIKFIYLNEFFWSGILYQSLFQFDGSSERVWENFDINFVNFRENLFYSDARALVKEALHNPRPSLTATSNQS